MRGIKREEKMIPPNAAPSMSALYKADAAFISFCLKIPTVTANSEPTKVANNNV